MYWSEKEGLMKWEKEDWDNHAKFTATSQINSLKEKEIGKFIFVRIGEAKKENDRRVFIDSLSIIHDVYTKDGWWNTFCLSVKEIEKRNCTALACIKNFKIDKNGYLVCMVEIERYFDYTFTNEDKCNKAFLMFADFGLISKSFISLTIRDFDNDNFNTTNVRKRFSSLIPEGIEENKKSTYLINMLFNYFRYGNEDMPSIKDIHKELEADTEEVRLWKLFVSRTAKDITNFRFGLNYAFMHTSINNYKFVLKKLSNRQKQEDYDLGMLLQTFLIRFREMVEAGKISEKGLNEKEEPSKDDTESTKHLEDYYFSRMEKIFAFYEEKKEKEKEERKAKRKGKKNNE